MGTSPSQDRMTRSQVARKFGVSTATIKNWARRSEVPLTEEKDSWGKPYYRCTEVELLYASGFAGLESAAQPHGCGGSNA